MKLSSISWGGLSGLGWPRLGRSQRRFAHVSDLHFGRSATTDQSAARLARALEGANLDFVVVTGNVTHRGDSAALGSFQTAFRRFASAGRLVVVPGASDTRGQNPAAKLMPGYPVQVAEMPGVYVIRVNSSAENIHARDEHFLGAIDAALDAAPVDRLVVIAIHHSVLPLSALPEVGRLSLVGSSSSVNPRAAAVLNRALGRADLVLHGERHVPKHTRIPNDLRPLEIFDAGCSNEFGWVRTFEHDGAGKLKGAPTWLDIPRDPEAEHTPVPVEFIPAAS